MFTNTLDFMARNDIIIGIIKEEINNFGIQVQTIEVIENINILFWVRKLNLDGLVGRLERIVPGRIVYYKYLGEMVIYPPG